jgi:hypothetical protein
MGKLEQIVSDPDAVLDPPASTAKLVLAHRKRLEVERDGLRTGAAELALKSVQGDAAAQAELAAIPARHAAVTFEIDMNAAAHEIALKNDSDAEIACRKSLQDLPTEVLLAGLNKDECCRLCQPGITGGCVLGAASSRCGSTCWHPIRFGALHQFSVDSSGRKVSPFANSPASRVFDAACDKLNVRGKFSHD